MNFIFPLGFVFFMVVKLLVKPSSSDKEVKAEKLIEESISINQNSFQYLVNGKIINNTHHIYYLRSLGLLNCNEIFENTITEAAREKLQLVDVRSYGDYEKRNEIIAARNFLLDQLNYCVWKN